MAINYFVKAMTKMITINIEKSVVRNDEFSHYVVVEYNSIPITIGVDGYDAAIKMQETSYIFIRNNGIEKFMEYVNHYYDLDVDN